MAELTTEFDLIIAGGGMVGGLLAAAVARQSVMQQVASRQSLIQQGDKIRTAPQPLRICVLEGQMPAEFKPGSNPPYDLRVSALSVASQHMLENVGAWQGISKRRMCPFQRLSVWDGQPLQSENDQHKPIVARGRTDFNAADVGAPALGHIVENRVIQLALLEQLQSADNVTLKCPTRLVSFRADSKWVDVKLDSGERIRGKLLVGADGARSAVRRQAGIDVNRTLYPQHALVATIETELPQQNITWQRFVPTGAQAFLPLSGSRASMVWYHSEEEVTRLKALPDKQFIEAMQQCFPSELGAIKQLYERGSFPLVKSHAKNYIANRVALIGDAAHTVHPLAGQGVNLGLLDAGALAEVIIDAIVKHRDIGERRQLRRYERWRRGENALMINAFDGFFHVFKTQPLPVRQLRRTALDIANNVRPLKNFLMGHAMGINGNLPILAQPSIRS